MSFKISQSTIKHTWKTSLKHKQRKQGYAVITPEDYLENYNPAIKKITRIQPQITPLDTISLPLESSWEEIRTLNIKVSTEKTTPSTEKIHYYCGGLPALMQAARKVEAIKGSKEKVIYANDGLIPKSLQSGHQGHVHPSEWASPDCSSLNLFQRVLSGMGILKESNPLDLAHYSYLHFPISFKEIFSKPIEHLSLYSQFFMQRVRHNLNARNEVSEEDRWLCRCVEESLAYHKHLSKMIEEQQGFPSFTDCGRIYWSPNKEGMLKKEKTWKELGIECYFIDEKEIKKCSLLKEDSGLSVLKIVPDGKFYPLTPQRILRYLQENYPNYFSFSSAHVDELSLDYRDWRPVSVKEKTSYGKEVCIPIETFFGSLGHNQVLLNSKLIPLWLEVPVSGHSTLWKCRIPKKELRQRLGTPSDERLAQYVQNIIPAANLSNLHVTCLNTKISKNDIEIDLRASQGAHFNSHIAHKDDLRNMWANIDHFFIGKWELISVGTCTRKTHLSNVPEYVDLSQNNERPAAFIHGLSGIGYSFSGASLETLKSRDD